MQKEIKPNIFLWIVFGVLSANIVPAIMNDISVRDARHQRIVTAQTQEELGAACHDYMAYPADRIPFRCTQFIGE